MCIVLKPRPPRLLFSLPPAVAMLFYGGKFAKCMLLYQTAKVTAGPTVSKGFSELYNKYVSARAEIAEQASTIVDAAGTLKQFTKDVKQLQKEMDTAMAKFKVCVASFPSKPFLPPDFSHAYTTVVFDLTCEGR